MSEGVPYADIVILALIAGFILLRLRSVLGSKMGNDNPDFFTKAMPQAQEKRDTIVQLDEKHLKTKPKDEPDTYLSQVTDSGVTDALNRIKARDPSFSATRFLEGARGAFEMVFDAFVKGDRQTLKILLSEQLFEEFSREIDQRESSEHKSETTLVSVAPKDVTAASLDKNAAKLSVRFESEQVTLVKNAKGDIIEGDPSQMQHIEDVWTFERDVTSKNPNWKIIET